MVFWKTYPLSVFFRTLYPRDAFVPLLFDRHVLESPSGKKVEIYTSELSDKKTLEKVLNQVRIYLRSYFGNPPETPILNIPILHLLGKKDHILIVRDISENIIGCIRYKYLGLFDYSQEEIYSEDCFCIHPEWRRKGIGDYLLQSLHNYVNQNNIPFSIFLKEGRALSIIHKPHISGFYVYTETPRNTQKPFCETIQISADKAFELIDIFQEFNNNSLFVIRRRDPDNQIWLLFTKNIHRILVCVQNTFQITDRYPDSQSEPESRTQKRIGWITTWFETSLIPESYKTEAISQILYLVRKEYDYIWANSIWIPESLNWKKDGPFHWYTYQWATNINIKKSYCITL